MVDRFFASYIGNAKYCFANSASMLLSSINEHIPPEVIEVLTGTGLSATMRKKDEKLYFNNQTLEPDLGLQSALALLGIKTISKAQNDKKSFPLKELKELLTNSKVVLGPLNMGYLTYQPNYKYLMGVDHYILAIGFERENIIVHDPAEFPYSLLPLDDLRNAWMPNGSSSYKKGYYRYLANPKRIEKLSENEIYEKALKRFQEIYTKGIANTDKNIYIRGKEAIKFLADKVKHGIEKKELGHYIYFAFALGAKRANDFSLFFRNHNAKLFNNKEEQAKLLGFAHSYAVKKDWQELSQILLKLANKEEEFEKMLTL